MSKQECFYCKDTGIIEGTEVVPGDKLPDQICPNCEIGQAVLKGKRMAEAVQLAELEALKASHKRLVVALRKYGSHSRGCDSHNKYRKTMGMGMTQGRCDCGLEQALEEAEKIGE